MRDYLLILLVLTLSLSLKSQEETRLVTQEKNLGTITTLSYSPDGTLIASGSEGENTIKVWDVRSGKVIGVLPGHESHIEKIAFHPTSDFIASTDDRGKVLVWNLNEWEMTDSITYDYGVIDLAFSADGNQLIAASEKGEFIKAAWQTEKSFSLQEKLSGEIVEVKTHFNFNQSSIVTARPEIIIIDEHGNKLKSNKISASKSLGLRFISKDEGLLMESDGDMTVINLKDLSVKSEVNTKSNRVLSFDVDAASQKLVFTTKGKDITIWDIEKMSKEFQFSNKNAISKDARIEEPIQFVSFSPDGNTVATSSYRKAFLSGGVVSDENSIKIWNLRRKELFKILKGEVNPISCFAFHPEKNWVITFGGQRQITYWDLNTAEKAGRDSLVERKIIPKILDDKNDKKGKKLGKLFGDVITGRTDVVDMASDVAVDKTKEAIVRKLKKSDLISFSSHGNYFLTSLTKDEVRIYDVDESGLIHHKTHAFHTQDIVNDLCTDQDEEYLFCLGSGKEAISVVDLESGKEITKLQTREEDQISLNYIFDGVSLAVSPDNKYLTACFLTGKVLVYRIGSWQKVFENYIDVGFQKVIVKGAFANFTEDGTRLIVNDNNGINAYTVPGFNRVYDENFEIKGQGIPLNKAANFAVTKSDDEQAIYIERFDTHEKMEVPHIHADWVTYAELNKNNLLGMSMRNGEFKFIDTESGKEIISLVGEDEKYIFKTPENYYKVSKDGYDLVTFRKGRSAYPFEQFDTKFNRPDIVLETLKCDNPDLIALYKRAYEKRLKKLGVKESDLSYEIHLPTVNLSNRKDIPLVTQENELTLTIRATDEKYNLKALKIWINNVPVFGRNGKDISGKQWNDEVNIPLGAGLNRIQLAVTNDKNTNSLYEFIDIELDQEVKPNLYLLSIGTSEYQDSRYNLNYAAKDANDLVSLFNKENEIYTEVFSKTLTNEEVVKDDFMALKDFLKDAKINDVIMVFIAGHGLLSSELDYYYATHNVDFTAPEGVGLEYSQIEYILENILTLKKILIMDTCHSGEVDKDEVSMDAGNEEEENQEDIAFRNVGPAVKQNEKVSPSKMAKELFTDVRKGTGATVISSAGGAEFAMESDKWKNGLFTYCLLNGLTNRTADLNKDGTIMLSELQKYVKNKVSKLSHGRQVPTTRVQNYTLDYAVW